MKEVTKDEIMELMGANDRLESKEWRTIFDPKLQQKVVKPSVRERIEAAIVRNKATHLVLFENHDFCSSQFGTRSVVCVGPDCTYRTPQDCEGKWLNDLPSQRQYATAFCAC